MVHHRRRTFSPRRLEDQGTGSSHPARWRSPAAGIAIRFSRSSLLLSRFRSLGFRSNKAPQYLKPSSRRQNKTSRLRTSSRGAVGCRLRIENLPLKAHVAVEVDAVAATAARAASRAKPLPPRRNKIAQESSSSRARFLRRLKIRSSRDQADLPNPSCLVFPSNRWATPVASRCAGRYGDPGLSSRLSLLEMQFRRLLTCAPVKLDEADRAPRVRVCSWSRIPTSRATTTSKPARLCASRFPILLRGGSSRRGADSIKPQLASHLGIAETRVGKYLADHCVVRWLQLDEGASHFAHFVIAVLRPVLNE